jgi:hypothetical protein
MLLNELFEVGANPDYLRAAERSRKDAQDTQRQYWKNPEEKTAARRTELKRDAGIAGYSKRHRAAHPEMYPKIKAQPAAKLRDPSTEYSDDYSTWAAGRRDTQEQGVAEGPESKKFKVTYELQNGDVKEKIMIGKDAKAVAKYFEFKYRHKPISVVEQGVAESDDIGYHQTSGTKAGHTISSRKLSNKPQASKSDVTLQSGSMHHSGKSYNFPKGTLFTQLPGGIFAKHPDVPETHPGYGHLIRRSEDNIHAIHNALNGQQGVAEGDRPGMKDGRPYSDPLRRHPGNDSYMTPEYLIQKYQDELKKIAAGPYKRPKDVAMYKARIAKLQRQQGVAEGRTK